jgi:hypothetical protein
MGERKAYTAHVDRSVFREPRVALVVTNYDVDFGAGLCDHIITPAKARALAAELVAAADAAEVSDG